MTEWMNTHSLFNDSCPFVAVIICVEYFYNTLNCTCKSATVILWILLCQYYFSFHVSILLRVNLILFSEVLFICIISIDWKQIKQPYYVTSYLCLKPMDGLFIKFTAFLHESLQSLSFSFWILILFQQLTLKVVTRKGFATRAGCSLHHRSEVIMTMPYSLHPL